MVAAWHWNGGEEIPHVQGQELPPLLEWPSEEIPHIQGQRNPSKMAGAGVVAVWHWSGCEEIPYAQG